MDAPLLGGVAPRSRGRGGFPEIPPFGASFVASFIEGEKPKWLPSTGGVAACQNRFRDSPILRILMRKARPRRLRLREPQNRRILNRRMSKGSGTRPSIFEIHDSSICGFPWYDWNSKLRDSHGVHNHGPVQLPSSEGCPKGGVGFPQSLPLSRALSQALSTRRSRIPSPVSHIPNPAPRIPIAIVQRERLARDERT